MALMNPPCPLLPPIAQPRTAADLNVFSKSDRGPAFYLACLEYAQSLWQKGLPAQAILQCNRALSVPLDADEPVLREWPLPYQALAWILVHRPAGQFIGNPRRHWQHLATRMVEPHKALRTWRAWACWYLSTILLPETEFPADLKQIREEGVVEPTFDTIFQELGRHSHPDDLAAWQHALRWAKEQSTGKRIRSEGAPEAVAAQVRVIGPEELPVVIDLARRIWPVCYPGIISDAQIDYMLAVWYEQGAMHREMTERGVTYALIEVASGASEAARIPVGYIGFERQPQSRVLFLSKLYLLPDYHGLGLGQIALDWVVSQVRTSGCEVLRLRVNKNNAPAIRAYRRAGFQFVEDLCSDIGNGFVMDDYLMERAVEGSLVGQPVGR